MPAVRAIDALPQADRRRARLVHDPETHKAPAGVQVVAGDLRHSASLEAALAVAFPRDSKSTVRHRRDVRGATGRGPQSFP